jgi:hypothetical protein
MRANSIWGFIGLAFGLFVWWAQSLGTEFGKEWAPWMWAGIVLCAAGAIIAWLSPRIAGTYNLERESHKLALYNADPAIQAFRETRSRSIQNGEEPQDTVLGILLLLLVTQTAWGRWQAKQNQVPLPVAVPVKNSQFLRIAESHFLRQLEQGKLAARGFYNGNSNDIRFISPDWWGHVYIEVIEDSRQIYKATIKPREDVDPDICERFTSISCELGKFFALFPKEDTPPKQQDPPADALEPEHT